MNLWYSSSGERVVCWPRQMDSPGVISEWSFCGLQGTYHGHNGTVWTCAIDTTSSYLVTGSADNTIRVFSVRTGECLKVWEVPTAIKRVAFSEDDSKILACTEQRMGHKGTIHIYDIPTFSESASFADEPSMIIDCSASKATVAIWSALDQWIISAHEDGSVCQWDPKSGDLNYQIKGVHEGTVMDMQKSADGTYIVTASRDKTSKVGMVIYLSTASASHDSLFILVRHLSQTLAAD